MRLLARAGLVLVAFGVVGCESFPEWVIKKNATTQDAGGGGSQDDGGVILSDAGPACKRTCTEMGYDCGLSLNECGDSIDCGA